MGTYTTYFGRLRLSKSTPKHVRKAIKAMLVGEDTIDDEPFLMQHPEVHNVFLKGGYNVADFKHVADFRDAGSEYRLTFCTSSKMDPFAYHWLLNWLSPWLLYDMGDMVMAVVDENYETDIVQDKVAMSAYRWTPWRMGWKIEMQVDTERPWDNNPWFRPFLTGVIE